MAKRRRETEPDGAMQIASEYSTVFVDTNLDSHLAMVVYATDTVLDFKKKIIQEHVRCFPQTREIQIHSMKVKRRENYYHLPDLMLVWSAFCGVQSDWFLSADISVSSEGDINHKNHVIGEKDVSEMSDELMIKNSSDKTAEFFSDKPGENSAETASPAKKKRKIGHNEDRSNIYPSDRDTLEPVLVGCRNSDLDAGPDENTSDTSPLKANIDTANQLIELNDQGKTSPMKIDSPITDRKDNKVDQPDMNDEEQRESAQPNDFPGADGKTEHGLRRKKKSKDKIDSSVVDRMDKEVDRSDINHEEQRESVPPNEFAGVDGETEHGTKRKKKSKKSKGEIRVGTESENSGSALHLTPPPVPNPEMDTQKTNEAEKTDGILPTAETDLNLDSEEHKDSDSSAKLMAANLSVEDAKDNSNDMKKNTAHKEHDTLDKELETKKTERIGPLAKIRKSKKKDEERNSSLNHDLEASKNSAVVLQQKEAVSGSKLLIANISEEPEISSGITTIRKKKTKRVMKSDNLSMEQTKATESFSHTKEDMENGKKKKSKSKKSGGKINGEIDGRNSESNIQLTPPNLPNLDLDIPKNHEIEDTGGVILPIDEPPLTLGSKADIHLSMDHDLDIKNQKEADLTIKEPNVLSGTTEIGNANGDKKKKKKSRKDDTKIQETSDVQTDQAQKNSENKLDKDSNPNEMLEADRNVIESAQQENSSHVKGETENGDRKKSKAKKSRGKIHDETEGEHSEYATHLTPLPLPNLDPKNHELEGDSATLMDANANTDQNNNKKKKKTKKPTKEIQDTTSDIPLEQAQKNFENVLKTDSNLNNPPKKTEAQEKITSLPLPNLDPNIPKNHELEGDSATLMDASANIDQNKKKKKKKTEKPTKEIQDTTSDIPLDQAQKNLENVQKTVSNPKDAHKKTEAQEKITSLSKSSSETSKIIPKKSENKSGQLGIEMSKKIVSETPQKMSFFSNMSKKIVSQTPQKKSLFSKSGALFEDSSGESCGDESGPAYSDASTLSPSDSSSQSEGEGELTHASTRIGSNDKTKISTGGKNISKLDLFASNGMPMDLSTVLRSSKQFKKAKLITSSQTEDVEPIEFPDSQNNS